MKIIAVDDERIALEGLLDVISEAAPTAELTGFEYPEDALAFVDENNCNIAFLDVEMSGMSGVELAEQLKLRNPDINIIFATGFEEYRKEAYDLHASGYLTKPITAEKVKKELADLRRPIPKSVRLQVQAFGNFEVYGDNIPVKFERKQSKEILAYLIDKRGTSVTYSELAAVLWESGEYDRTQQKNLQVYIASLAKSLNAAGVRDLILKSRSGIVVNTSIVDWDYYRFLEGDTRAINSFAGQYMSAYSWAEFTTGYLDYQFQKLK